MLRRAAIVALPDSGCVGVHDALPHSLGARRGRRPSAASVQRPHGLCLCAAAPSSPRRRRRSAAPGRPRARASCRRAGSACCGGSRRPRSRLPRSAFSVSASACSPAPSRLEFGSSRITSLGSPYSARASAMRWRCPGDSSAPRRVDHACRSRRAATGSCSCTCARCAACTTFAESTVAEARDVLGHGAGEQLDVLRHVADVRAELLARPHATGRPGRAARRRRRLPHAGEQAHQRRLAGAARPDDGQRFAGLELQRYAGEDQAVALRGAEDRASARRAGRAARAATCARGSASAASSRLAEAVEAPRALRPARASCRRPARPAPARGRAGSLSAIITPARRFAA